MGGGERIELNFPLSMIVIKWHARGFREFRLPTFFSFIGAGLGVFIYVRVN